MSGNLPPRRANGGKWRHMEIIISEENIPEIPILELFNRAGELCASEAGLSGEGLEVSVTFISPDEIRELNLRYRDKDSVTDVLSFPQYDSLDEISGEEHLSLGDVVICTEQAIQQADDFGHSRERELVYLFVHGMLHLLAYDHESEGDRSAMRLVEERVMAALELVRE